MTATSAFAYLGGRWASDLQEVSDDLRALDTGGFWAVMVTFEGAVTCARFGTVSDRPPAEHAEPWASVSLDTWQSSMGRAEYIDAVETVRAEIAAGEVYQVNVCRVLSTSHAVEVAPRALIGKVLLAHPAPYAAALHLPDHDVAAVSASPELFLRLDDGVLTSRPIKGTTEPGSEFLAKDRAENVMIVDLVRNDLGAVAETGSVEVVHLCEREEHPGLSHLVSTVQARVAPAVRWPEIMAATFPPGSVSGAPKHTALKSIRRLETTPRGPYCGAFGWVDTDARRAELAVGIRTFWWADGRLHLGTGAGITWASDAAAEWDETELKARQLLALVAS